MLHSRLLLFSPLPASVAAMQHAACACLHTMWGHHAEV